MENTELIKALRRLYTVQDTDNIEDWVYGSQQAMCDAADALEAADKRIDGLQKLVDINTERCEALRKQLRESHESYEKHINELEAQLPKWVSVEDKLPEESGEYTVYIQMGTGVEVPDFFGSNDLSYVTSVYFKKGQKLWFDEYEESYNADLSLVDTANEYHITHWMPLPQKPKGEHDD